MPLPADPKQPWPPKVWAPLQRDLDEASVWYAGDPEQLARFYTNTQSARPSDKRFSWGRKHTEAEKPKMLHVPAAGDVAATSADLLFGESPALTIPEAHEAKSSPEAKAAEDRLATLADLNGFSARLLEGAEVCAAIGGVYLRPVWDQDFADHPILDIVHGDRGVPEFRWGRLTAVTFWRVVHTEASMVIRHLERHEPGVILHGLYVGTTDKLGTTVPLESHPSTAGLEEQQILPAGLLGLDCRYVPNVLPNRKHRGWPVGRADTAGAETLMDALDEAWTSWMRDIRLGKMRIIADREAFTSGGRGQGAWLDTDREVFTLLDMGPTSLEKGAHPITPVDFKLRVTEHMDTTNALYERIITTSGWSPQSFGLHIDGEAESGTALRIRQGKSLTTKARKQRYWQDYGADVAYNMLVIDREVFGSRIEPMRPRLDFADGIVDDPKERAETVELLARARAASVETLVRMAQPDLDEAEVQSEVQRIRDDEGLNVPDPTGGF